MASDIILKTENLTKSFFSSTFFLRNKPNKEACIFNNLSLNFSKGSFTGLVGPSGCGKSTLARIMAGLTRPTCGKVYYQDKEVQFGKKPLSLQIVFQNPDESFSPHKTIFESLKEILYVHKIVQKKDYKGYLEEFYIKMQLEPNLAKSYPSQLSGGQLQRFSLIRALIVKPKFLICDEIVTNLDIETKIETLEVLKSLIEDTSLSGLFISHDMKMVQYICSDIIKMENGGKCSLL